MNYEEFNKKAVLGIIEDTDIIAVESEMSPTESLQYNNWYKENSKNGAIAWILWFFAGGFGAQMLYVGLDKKYSKGLFIFTMIILGLSYITAGISLILLPISWIWSAILINTWIKEANKQAKIDAIRLIYATRK